MSDGRGGVESHCAAGVTSSWPDRGVSQQIPRSSGRQPRRAARRSPEAGSPPKKRKGTRGTAAVRRGSPGEGQQEPREGLRSQMCARRSSAIDGRSGAPWPSVWPSRAVQIEACRVAAAQPLAPPPRQTVAPPRPVPWSAATAKRPSRVCCGIGGGPGPGRGRGATDLACETPCAAPHEAPPNRCESGRKGRSSQKCDAGLRGAQCSSAVICVAARHLCEVLAWRLPCSPLTRHGPAGPEPDQRWPALQKS